MQKTARLIMEMEPSGQIKILCENIAMVELVTLAGTLQEFTGWEAVKRGKAMEDVKDSLLDVHLAAMQSLTEKVVRERKEE